MLLFIQKLYQIRAISTNTGVGGGGDGDDDTPTPKPITDPVEKLKESLDT